MEETLIWSLGWVDPLEKDMAAQSTFLAWIIPMDRRARHAAAHGFAKSWTQLSIIYSMDVSLSKLWELVMNREACPCCSPWGHKESDTTEWLNWTERVKHTCMFSFLLHVLNFSIQMVSETGNVLGKNFPYLVMFLQRLNYDKTLWGMLTIY